MYRAARRIADRPGSCWTQSLTAEGAEGAKEKKSFTAKDARDAKEQKSLTAKAAKE